MRSTLLHKARRFRTLPARPGADGPKSKIEREGGDNRYGIIRDVSLATRGEALGHGLWLDREFILQVARAAQAKQLGLKARFTHPGMSGDGLGKMLGRVRNVRIDADGNRVLGDLHFIRSATTSPDGNLAAYVMDLAADAPEDFGLSIVFSGDTAAEEAYAKQHTVEGVGFQSADPENLNNYPHARLQKLYAVDAVDEPAANPGGLFSALADPEGDFEAYSSAVEFALGISEAPGALQQLSNVHPQRVRDLVSRVLARRNLSLMPTENDMASCKLPTGEVKDGVTAEECAAMDGEYTPDMPAEEAKAETPSVVVQASAKPATPREIREACKGASDSFVLSCVESELSLAAASAAWSVAKAQSRNVGADPVKFEAPKVAQDIIDANSTDDEFEAKWKADKETRKKFGNDFKAFVAFTRAQLRGAVRIKRV